jgi:hypothetical protein
MKFDRILRRSAHVGVAVVLLALAVISPGTAQTATDMDSTLDTLFGDHAPYRTFLGDLKKVVADNDKAAVAAMVDYPFQARINGKALKIRDAAHFVADYDKIITAKVKRAVANQSYATLFANWQGVSIGDGEVWFSGVGDRNAIRITAIND